MEDILLNFLKKYPAQTFSKEQIAENTSLSIEKIESLLNNNQNIAVLKNGYRYLPPIAAEDIFVNLSHNTLVTQIEVLRRIDSTNNYLKQLAKNGAPEGTVIIAEEQTAGRGRRGKSFYSPAKNGVYMSILLRPALKLQQSVMITVLAAVAVCQALTNLCKIDAQIKWVNDILVNKRKLCGILTEATIGNHGENLDYAVLGIGINVYGKKDSFPREIQNIATSIEACLGQISFTKNQFIAEVLNCLDQQYKALSTRTFLQEYIRRSCVIGKEIYVLHNTRKEKVTALSIDEDAHLIVQDKFGNKKALNSGEISITT